MFVFHEEEIGTIMPVYGYVHDYPRAELVIEFAGGDKYQCVYDTAWESDNGGELDIEEDDPRYDEFHQVSFDIVKIIKDGRHRYNEYLTIDYRDFPVKITDITNNVVVYPTKDPRYLPDRNDPTQEITVLRPKK